MKKVFFLSCISITLCSAQSTITTVAGGGLQFPGNGGPATSASLIQPSGVTVDPSGNIYIVEAGIYRVRKVDTNGIITTIAGTGTPGVAALFNVGDNGPATQAQFLFGATHEGIAVDSVGNIYICDSGNYRVRKIDTNGIITTFAGTSSSIPGGDGGPANKAGLNKPTGVAIDSSGNVYIADTGSWRVRKVDTNGIITTFAGTGAPGSTGDGGPATSATLTSVWNVAVDKAGNVYVADPGVQRIRKVDTNGIISTIAGSGTFAFGGDGGPAIKASFEGPSGMAPDNNGGLYVVDSGNDRVRKIDAAGNISTVAGTGNFASSGDGGPPASASFQGPDDVFGDSTGAYYISDRTAGRIRKVSGPAGAGSVPPAITLVANAYGDTPLIAPNTWVEVKGTNLAPAGVSRIWQSSDFVNNQMPTQMNGVSVMVNGKSAYVYYISATQINILTPPDAMSGSVQVQVTSASLKSAPATVQAQAQSLALFEFVSGDGRHYVYGRHGSDAGLIGPTTLFTGLTTPVKSGESIFIAANGFGPTDTPVVSGSLTQSGTLPPPLPLITIGGITAQVTLAGLAGVGVYQINLVVPNGLPDGDNTITATYNGLRTQSNLMITVAH